MKKIIVTLVIVLSIILCAGCGTDNSNDTNCIVNVYTKDGILFKTYKGVKYSWYNENRIHITTKDNKEYWYNSWDIEIIEGEITNE